MPIQGPHRRAVNPIDLNSSYQDTPGQTMAAGELAESWRYENFRGR